MAPEDRDRQFDKALGRHVRSLCPDAETLAAYHERNLPLDELAQYKNHIASCADCQQILATLEATENAGDREFQKQGQFQHHAILAPASAPAPVARAMQEMPAGSESTGKENVKQMKPRSAVWKWAAPAGAIAAGLLLWIGMRDAKLNKNASAPQSVEIAENRPSEIQKTMDQEAQQQAKKLSELTSQNQELQSPRDKVASPSRMGSPNLSDTRQEPNAPPPAPSQVVVGAVSPALAAKRDKSEDELKPRTDSAMAENELRAQAARKETQQTQSAQLPEANANESSVSSYSGGAVGGAAKRAPAAAANAKQKEEKAQFDKRFASNLRASGQGFLLKDAYANTVSAPDGDVLWTAGSNGAVVQSIDGGKNWAAQNSGVSAALINGSAPSTKVCWLVGKDGTILRTVDGGKNWVRVKSPISGNLGGVVASDENHAAVWNEAGDVRYATADGGVTWNPVRQP